MPVDFKARAEALEAELAEVKTQLKTAPDHDKMRLTALQASLRRSLRWYTARAGSRSDVHALSVQVGDDIHTSTSN